LFAPDLKEQKNRCKAFKSHRKTG